MTTTYTDWTKEWKNRRCDREEALLHIRTYELPAVAKRAEEMLATDPDFSSLHELTNEQVGLLQREAWRTCAEVEDIISLPMIALFLPKGSGVPLICVLDWIDKRYGRLALICAKAVVYSDPDRYLDATRRFVKRFTDVRDNALSLFQDDLESSGGDSVVERIYLGA